jgi:diguanylate cyclase (GGDEF)-like protein
MNEIASILSWLIYLFLVITFARLVYRRHEIFFQRIVFDDKQSYQNLVHSKNILYDRKIRLEDEAMSILTLYEITKDITKSLNDETAFSIFKQKLAEHISFEECRLIDPGQDMSEYRHNPQYFVYPLQGKHRRIGYLLLRGMYDEDKEKAMIMGQQFALVLRRVRLYEEIERTAITDSLTEISTRRYVMERFKEEIGRARSRKLNLALMMIDVDHFKQLNDKYGHLAGDQVLHGIAKIIKTNIREIDIAGRYGGEEFCVVLPDTDKSGACFAAQRIREATERTAIKAYDNNVNVTVSIGIAIFPQDGMNAEEIIDKADWALYKAKKNGRNNVCLFSDQNDHDTSQ